MYNFLYKHFGVRVANIGTVLWYVLLIFLVYYFSPLEDGEFRYLDY